MSENSPINKPGVYTGPDKATAFALQFKQEVQERSKDKRNIRRTNVIPVQENQRDRLESALDNLNDIISPQMKAANLNSTKAAMLDRLYKKINPFFHKHTECFQQVNNVAEANDCTDQLI